MSAPKHDSAIIERRRKQLDVSAMFDILQNFPNHIIDALKIGSESPYFTDRTAFRHLVFSGMGGSAIGGDLLRTILAAHGVTDILIQVSRNYTLPPGINADTAFIASSYSGSTEETLAAFTAVQKLTKRLLCISAGGELQILAKKAKVPVIQIPGGMQPRCAVAYSFFPLLTVLLRHTITNKKAKTSLKASIDELLPLLIADNLTYSEPHTKKNTAFILAQKIQGTIPVFYSSPALEALNLRWRGQIQENAKHLAFGNIIPEMNHNEINGWGLPQELAKQCSVILMRDPDDHERNQVRFEAIKPILKKRVGQLIEVQCSGQYFLTRVFRNLYLADWTSYWLAILNNQDPTTIDDIMALKKRLSKQ